MLWQPRTCSFEDNDIDAYICLVYVYIHLNTNRYSKMNSHNVNTEMFLNPKLLTTCLEKIQSPKLERNPDPKTLEVAFLNAQKTSRLGQLGVEAVHNPAQLAFSYSKR